MSRQHNTFLLIVLLLGAALAGWTAPVTFNDTALLNTVKTQWETATGLTLSDPPEDSELANALFTTLDAKELGISDLTGLEACTSLTHINLGLNQISDLTPLSGLTGLLWLDLGFGTDIFSLTNFDEFIFDQTGTNLITTIAPLAGLVNLEYLSVMGNDGMTSIAPISTMDSLAQLWLASNPISDFSPLSDVADTLTVFLTLNCGLKDSDAPIINSLTNLQALGIVMESGITDISGLTGISPTLLVAVVGTGITDISVVTNYTNLQQFFIMDSSISAFPNLSGLASLHTIMAFEGQFNDISGLSGLTSLQMLDLKGNNISDISALETCTALKAIKLKRNQLTDIQPLLDNAGIAGLQDLNIEENPFYSGTPFCDESQLDQLIALAPAAQISQDATCMVPVTLTVIVTGTGLTEPGAGTHIFGPGETVSLTARPISGSGWAFDHWAGDGSGTSDDIGVTMDSDKTVEAVFVTPGDHTLTVQHTGNGSGDTSYVPGVYSFLDGRQALLQAWAFPGSYFGGWQGDLSGYTPTQQLIMNGDKTVSAVFENNGYDLTLNVSGNGEISQFYIDETRGFTVGAVLDLHAAPSSGNTFDHWEGDIGDADSQSADIQITMDQDRSITAVFSSLPQALLTINVAGTGSGTTNPPAGVNSVDLGSGVWVQAIPASGSAFDHWEGDIGSANPYQNNILLMMDQDRTLTAFFVPAAWILSIQKTGNGTTDPVPGDYGFINGAQKAVYARLTDGGDAFYHWTGDLAPGTDEYNTYQNVTMNQNRTLTAEFVPGDWTLTIISEGFSGESCFPPYPGLGTFSYLNGQTENVSASTCPGTYFAGWSGDATGFMPSLSIPMDADKSITAHYTTTGFELTTAISGQGGMNINPGTYYLSTNATITLTAEPWGGWVFDHWEGDIPAGENPNEASLDITMDQDRSLTAVMSQLPTHTLTIAVLGPGTTDPGPGAHEFVEGSYQNIFTTPDPGAAFDHWEGDIGSNDPTQSNITLLMDQDRSITAVFAAADWILTIVADGNGTTRPEPGVYGFMEGAETCVESVVLAGGDAFSQWTGDLESGVDSEGVRQCVTMNRNRTLTAEFTTGDWTLTLATAGSTSSSLYPGAGIFSYLDGQIANVFTSFSSDAYFAGWTGDYTSTEPQIQVLMDADKSITANYESTGYTLTMSIDGQGYVNFGSGEYGFAAGVEVTLNAPGAPSSWFFYEWSGDLPEGIDPSNPELTVTMDQDRSITAHFIEDYRTLTVIIEGEGVTSPSGSAYPGTTHKYSVGAYVFLSAELGDEEYAFSHWSGDTGSLDTDKWFLEIVMDQDRTIIAHFEPTAWHLTINYTGIGSIFPETGTYPFPHGAHFEVIANIIDGGDAFYEWTGDIEEGMDSHQFDMHVTMDRDRSVTAVFSPGDFTLTMNPIEGGGSAWYQPSAGVYSYFAGQTAWMEARPNEGMYWGGWSGDVNTYDKIYHFVMDSDKVITPHVTKTGFTLTLNTAGAEGVTSPEGSIKYSSGATPLIHAIETGSGLWDQWTGDLPTGMDPTDPDPIILMDQNRALTANFIEADFYLYVQAFGNGTTDPPPDVLYWFMDGDTFEVTAIAGADTLFLHWQGDVPEGQDPASLTISGIMTQNRELIAVFVPTTVTVPDLSGNTEEQAAASLAVIGLTLGTITEEYSQTVPADQILSQDPGPGTVVPYGSAISIVISLGPCYASVPNLEGLTQAEAETSLAAANLILGTVAEESSDIVPEGQIIRQQPVYGLLVACDSAVNIVVSSGIGGEGSAEGPHTADQDNNNVISLSELLRVIQFFNSNGLHCQAGTEDGFAPGSGDQTCAAHDSDYNPQDWLINLSELLRIIQFFNSGGYHACPGEETEDGFCPGLA